MIRQEQVTIAVITLFLIALSVYFLIDFYINASLYDMDQTMSFSQAAAIIQENITNTHTNSEIEIATNQLNR